MSWDICVFAAKEPPPPVDEMPNEWRGEPLGTTAEVRSKISACLPEVDWSNPEWGHYDSDGLSLEFNVGGEGPSDGFMVHVRGGGDAVQALLKLSDRWNWYLLDVSQREWLHHCSNVEAGWKGFQEYRNRVLGRDHPETER